MSKHVSREGSQDGDGSEKPEESQRRRRRKSG
jgi:hypothetical protein